MVRRTVWAPIAFVFGLGCSNTETITPATCGTGTEYLDGTCVASDASSIDSTSVVTDTATDAVATTDGAVDGTPSDSMDATAEDAFASSDPCPSPAPLVDCSSACGGPSSKCANMKCTGFGGRSEAMLEPVDVTTLPATVRTPDRPPADANCICVTGEPKPTYEMLFRVKVPTGKFRVSVDPPWKLANEMVAPTECPRAGIQPVDLQCVVVPASEGWIIVYAVEPGAPARNVHITAEASCP
jgi:hypothetical protein